MRGWNFYEILSETEVGNFLRYPTHMRFDAYIGINVKIFSADFEVLRVLMYACLIQLSRCNKIKAFLLLKGWEFSWKLINILHIRTHILKDPLFLSTQWIHHNSSTAAEAIKSFSNPPTKIFKIISLKIVMVTYRKESQNMKIYSCVCVYGNIFTTTGT